MKVRVFSEWICYRVIFQKMVFGILCGYSLFTAISFRVIDAWSSEFLTIGLLYYGQYYSASFKDFCSKKCRRCVDLGSPTCSASYLDWYNSCPCPLCVQFTPYRNCEDAIFVRWMDCNTLLPEYVLSCVFRFFDRIFRFTSCICFVL